MCRRALQKTSGEQRIFIGKIEKIPHEGRLTIKNVVIFDKSGSVIVDYVQHVNIAKSPFKHKKYKKGDIIRFTGRPYKYSRNDNSEDYAITPGQNNRKVSINEEAAYNTYLNDRRRSKNKKASLFLFLAL